MTEGGRATAERQPDVGISHVSTVPETAVQPFLDQIAHPSLAVKTERREQGIYMSLEWLVPTAVIIYVSKSYFDGFLKEAGKDHYNALKKGVAALWSYFFGKERTFTTTVAAFPPGKASSDRKYSLALSLMAEGTGGLRFKLLLAEASTKEELETAVGQFQDFLARFHVGEIEESMGDQLLSTKPSGGIVLVAYDPQSGALHVVNPRPVNLPPTAPAQEG